MSPEEWLKQQQSKDSALSPEEWIKQQANVEKAVEIGLAPEAVLNPPQLAGMDDSVNAIAEANKNEPSWKRQAAGLATNIAISESFKVAGTTGGAAFGGAISTPTGGAAAPATVPISAGIGYVSMGLTGGFLGSIAQQEIEGEEEISYGKASINAILNLIPGGVGKGAKYGPKWFRAFMGSAAKHPIASTAAIGAVAGPAQLAGERYVETGELPSTEEMVKTGLVTSVFGAGIGKTSEYGMKLLGKFAGRSEATINSMVRKGNKDAVNYIDMVSQGVNPDDFIKPEDTKKLATEIIKTVKARAIPSSTVGTDVAREIIEAKNVAMAGKETGAILNRKVSNFIQASADPAATEKMVFDYVTGSQGPIPMELSPIADDIGLFRSSVNKYQKQLVDNHYNGQREMPDLLLKKVEESMNKGDYLTSEYEFFLNPKYQPSEKATRELKARLIADGMDNNKAESYIAELNAKKAVGPDEVERFVYSQNAGILKEKKDLSPELRRYLGEVQGIGERMEGTMSKLSRLVAYDTSDYNIKMSLRQMGLAKLPGEGVEGIDMVPLNLRRGLAKEGEEQFYVPKDVQTAMNSLYGMDVDTASTDYAKNAIQDFFETGIAASKASKVVLNPISYAVQFYGNVIGPLGMAMNPFKGYGRGVKMATAQFGPIAEKLKSADIATLKKYKELGLLGQGIQSSDIRSGTTGKIGSIIREPINIFGKVYSTPDIAGRISVFENNMEFLRKSFPDVNTNKELNDATEKLAARMTNATYPNYDYINKSLKTLGFYGALGQFSSFSFELMRNQFNQINAAWKMINGSFAKKLEAELGPANSKIIAQEGAKRLAALATVYAGTIAGVELWNKRKSGMTEEQINAAKESVLPEYEKNSQLALKKTDDGKIYWNRVSYLVPHAQLAAPAVSAMNGEDFKSAAMKGFETLWDDIGGEGNFLMNSIVPAIQNYNPKTGRPISKQPDRIDAFLEKAQWFAETTWEPGAFTEYERATSQTKPQPASQTLMRLGGIRVNDTTIEDGARIKINGIKDNLTSLASDLSYMRHKKVGPEFDAEYQKINDVYRANVQELSKHAKNYRILGKTEDEVIKMMRDNGIGANMTLAALDGRIIDLPKAPRVTITDRYEALTGTRQEKEKQINEIAKTDPFAAKSLAEKHKQTIMDETLNISERDKAIRSLDVNDGTRSQYIWDQMQQSQNPDGVLKQFIKRGLVNKEVMYQIELRKKQANEN